MISKVWAGLILVSCFAVVLNGAVFDNLLVEAWVKALFDMSELSIDIALGLVGALCFWMGLFQIAQASGLVLQLGHLFEPLLLKLMPSVPPGHPAVGAMTMNIAANVFGLETAMEQVNIFAGNMLQVQGADKKYLVMSARAHRGLTDEQISRIEKHCEILSSEIKTIETCGGGSARCMMAEVFLPKA